MPYKANRELPTGVKNILPDAALSIFRNTFNAQSAKGLSDERSFASAWGAVKNAGYEKGSNGKWAKVEKAGDFDESKHPRDADGKFGEGGGDGGPKFISREELLQRTQQAGDRERISRAKAALAAGKEVSIQDVRDAGVTETPAGYTRRGPYFVPTKKSASFTAEIKKVSGDDQRLVFGWASIIEDADGNLVADSQGDVITPEELEKAAYAFVHDVRKAGDMHRTTDGVGQIVESMVLTKAKRESMGLPAGPTGWWIGMKVAKQEVWDKIKSGEYAAFSIGGKGLRKEIEEGAK